jgi:type III secretory pathway lipoprotein EscJ
MKKVALVLICLLLLQGCNQKLYDGTTKRKPITR